MHAIRRSWMLPALLGACLAAAPAAAGQAQRAVPDGSAERSPGELAQEGLQQMMRALRLLVESIPQYELPEVLENGDIIIRRKDRLREPDARDPDVYETSS